MKTLLIHVVVGVARRPAANTSCVSAQIIVP